MADMEFGQVGVVGEEETYAFHDFKFIRSNRNQTSEQCVHMYEDGIFQSLSTAECLESLMGVEYSPHLLFESKQTMRNYALWGITPNLTRGIGSRQSEHVCALLDINCTIDWPSPQIATPKLTEDLSYCNISPIAIARIPRIEGFGVFAMEDIEPGSLIAEYTGIVRCSGDTIGQSFDAYALNYPTNSESNMIISGKDYGSIARIINHASVEASNTSITYVLHYGVARVAFITSCFVPRGAQILANYGQSYWKAAGFDPIDLSDVVLTSNSEHRVPQC